MDDQIVTSNYFSEPGPQNTEATFTSALKRARELGLTHVVVATDSGKTAFKALDVFGDDYEIIAVTNSDKMMLPLSRLHDYTERFKEYRDGLVAKGIKGIKVGVSAEVMEELEGKGIQVSRIDWKRFNAFVRRDVNGIDVLGVAVRVALTCSVWARVNRCLPQGEVDVIAIAGTGFGGGGADTALVVRTNDHYKDFRVLETLVRPRVSPPSMLGK